jgi:hypothetical protein
MKLTKETLKRIIKEELQEASSAQALDFQSYSRMAEDIQSKLLQLGDVMKEAGSKSYRGDVGGSNFGDNSPESKSISFYKMTERRQKEMEAVRDFLDSMEFLNEEQTLSNFLKSRNI